MFGTILNLLTVGLDLWNSKEKNKYIDKKMALEKAYYEEFNKPDGVRADSVLDNLEFELHVLSTAFCAQAGKQNTETKPN